MRLIAGESAVVVVGWSCGGHLNGGTALALREDAPVCKPRPEGSSQFPLQRWRVSRC